MSYLERERKRVVEERERLFRDTERGVFAGKPREFVLGDASANLWDGIRLDALEYFTRNGIRWWKGEGDNPTGHLLSSQVACINHLYPLRQREDLATAVLRNIDGEVRRAVMVDDGFVEFEFIGKEPRLKERAFTRGANCTSIDAFMIGETGGGLRGYFIEWKYTETYHIEDKYIDERSRVYDPLIHGERSPFKNVDPRVFYFEPFYQMMRQTLLASEMAAHGDYGVSSWRHVHVAPEENREFHDRITSNGLKLLTGKDSVSDVWRSVLKDETVYVATSPGVFLAPLLRAKDCRSLTDYLGRRYWAGR